MVAMSRYASSGWVWTELARHEAEASGSPILGRSPPDLPMGRSSRIRYFVRPGRTGTPSVVVHRDRGGYHEDQAEAECHRS